MTTETIRIGEASLTTYVHQISADCPHPPRPAILVLPGGGYDFCYDGEAEPIALSYVQAGLNAYVLRYSCRERAAFPRPLMEAASAMVYIRRHAAADNTDPSRVFVIGFSAGGHLAGALATAWHRPEILRAADATGEETKPTGVILSYPVVSGGKMRHQGTFVRAFGKAQPSDQDLRLLSNDLHVDDRTPPMFLWHTAEDPAVPVQNSLLMAAALAEQHVPFELHVFPYGSHGLCLATEETAKGNPEAIRPDVAMWMPLSITWIRRF